MQRSGKDTPGYRKAYHAHSHWLSTYYHVPGTRLTTTLAAWPMTLRAAANMIIIFIFLLKDNSFTEFYFLSNLSMNQPQIYIYPLPFEPPSHLPPHPTLLG